MNNNDNNDKFNIDSEADEITRDFVSEAYHLLDKAVSIINELDTSHNKEAINTIFRLFHSIKGSAGFLSFKNIRNITHEAETLLDIYRKNKISPSPGEIDVLYQSFDLLEEMISSISEKKTDKGFEDYTDIIVKKIDKCIKDLILDKKIHNAEEIKEKLTNKYVIEQIDKEEKKSKIQRPVLGKNKSKKEDKEKIEEEKLDVEKFGLMSTFLDYIDKAEEITPEVTKHYIDEANKLLSNIEKYLKDLREKPYNKDLIMEVLKLNYNLKKNSEVIRYYDIEEIITKLEKVLYNIVSGRVGINQASIDIILDIFQKIKITINNIEPETSEENPAQIPDKKEITSKLNNINTIKATSGVFKPLGELLVEMGVVDNETVEDALELQKEQQHITEEGKDKEEDFEKKIKGLRKEDVIRVETDKLDQLFDLVGELTIAELMVTQNQDLKGLELENFENASDNLKKIVQELQTIIMSVRMVPLESLFNRMVRLVNQLQRNINKKVKLTISGASTEIDRKLINELYDPLVHIIRNSIDHGIEKTDKRKEKNKPETGNIWLEARHEGNEIWISIKDDGKGLNREKIIEKGINMNLLDNKDIDKMPDEKIWKLIFEPGFTTAKELTDISGRGVGMDVVKKNMEKLRGQIDVYSKKEEGTQITLKIPVTLEIMNVMVVEANNNKYSIPVTDVEESLAMREVKVIQTHENRESVRLREEIIPLMRLYNFFNLGNEKTINHNLNKMLAVVIKKNKKKLCIAIDDILGTQQIVIKSLPSYMGNLKIVSGCSILGSGEISLIIDSTSIINECIE
ncbi:MAG: chemotaxis protein CheA [Spirochaetota bacterium]